MLQSPRDGRDEVAHGLLESLSAAELEAGVYLAALALAAAADATTGELASAHSSQERHCAERLRQHPARAAGRAARR